MMKPYVKPSEMVKPPGMLWSEYMTKAFVLDREWGHELHSNVAVLQLLDATCERLAKARLEASGPRLMLPKTIMLASSKAPAKTGGTSFSRSRSSAEVQQAIARRMALR